MPEPRQVAMAHTDRTGVCLEKAKTKRSVMLLLSRDTFTRIVYKVPIKQYL